MKILAIAPYPPMTAPEADHALHLFEHLADRDQQVHVITTKGSVPASRPGITVHPIIHNWSWDDFQPLMTLIRDCSPDGILLFYIHWIYNFHPMIRVVPTAVKSMLPHVPFVTLFSNVYDFDPFHCPFVIRLSSNGISESFGPTSPNYTYGTMLRDSDRIIVLGEWMQSALEVRSPGVSGKIVLTPPPPIMCIYPGDKGAARQRLQEEMGVSPQDFLIVYFGYLYPGKGVETLVSAFHLVSTARSNVRLLLVGGIIGSSDFYAKRVLGMVKQLALDAKVQWTGQYAWDSDEASRYLRAADLCVLPFDNGIHLNNSSFAGAIAHGLPVLTTRGNFLERPFAQEENVFLCPPKNPREMATAIEFLMDRPDLCRRLQAGACQFAQEWFSWPKTVERTIEALAVPCPVRPVRPLRVEWHPGSTLSSFERMPTWNAES